MALLCPDCSEEAVCDGPLDKRTGFQCPGCEQQFHFKCNGLAKTKCLTGTALILLQHKAMKIPIDKLFYCDDCTPEDSLNSDKSAKSPQDAIDLTARAAIQKLEAASVAISAKLDFVVDFLTPSDRSQVKPQQTDSNVQQQPSYAGVAQRGFRV